VGAVVYGSSFFAHTSKPSLAQASEKSKWLLTRDHALLKLLQLLVYCGCGEWQEDVLLSDRLLTLAAQNKSQKLGNFRIERLSGRTVEVNVHRPAKGVTAIRHCLE
jgi:hypothetical protein